MSKHKIKIRMGASRYDFKMGDKVTSLFGFTEKEMNEASSMLIAFLQKKGFFRV